MTDPALVRMIVTVLIGVAAVVLGVAAGMTVVRISRGPSSLDRVVSADVLVAVVIAGLAADAVLRRHETTLPIMLVLSLLGFAGSVSIARFVAERDKAVRWDVDGPDGASEHPEPGAPDADGGEAR